MKRTGIFALPALLLLVLQGCVFLPVERSDKDDPFFFAADDVSNSADFVEASHYRTSAPLPPSSNHHCSGDWEMTKTGAACWFFPVMRVY
ncbi:hypothetical protein [Microbulbifer halophilus]|uniref:Lipoprotein n=1 Tax=Microbulbifer halophilus TaxID=453963 RepID=A0ABW5EAF2_9GAMM|nr:hypothetical protein [Microbulbifer halophilus]MCW8125050.1 hypothetical protein [Microbulbifer halophilus]